MDRKKGVFTVLLVLFIAVLAYNAGITGRDAASRPERAADGDQPALNTDLLDRKPSEYPGVKKDIFSPAVLPPATPGASARVIPQQPAVPLPVASPAPPPVPAPSALQAFASQAKFMGFLENGVHRTVFISKGQEVFTLKKGDLIEQRFIVESVSAKEIRFKDNATGEEIRILPSGTAGHQ